MPLPLLLLLTACSSAPEPTGVAMDGIPAGSSRSPDGRWRAQVSSGGALQLEEGGEEGEGRPYEDKDVLPELAWSPDSRALVYPRLRDGASTDLVIVDLSLIDGSGEAAARVLIDWPCSSDRPVFSPDGQKVAFVSGCTGIASLYVVGVEAGAGSALQLTNVGIEDVPHPVGQPPAGFIPVPGTGDLQWTAAVLLWTAGGQSWTVSPP